MIKPCFIRILHIAGALLSLTWLVNLAIGLGVTGLMLTVPPGLPLLVYLVMATQANEIELAPGRALFWMASIIAISSIAGAFLLLRGNGLSLPECGELAVNASASTVVHESVICIRALLTRILPALVGVISMLCLSLCGIAAAHEKVRGTQKYRT